jgi:hypothetical protein
MRTTRFLVSVLLVFAACGGDPEPEPTLSPTPTAFRTPSTGPSQPVADAQRDGVPTTVAALPFLERVHTRARLRTPEGIWVISRNEDGLPDLPEYAEILLLDQQEASIVRAYPLESVPPRWLTMTDQAVYCGRNGAGEMPYSMVCRIDRRTFAARIRIYTDERWIPGDHPHGWELDPFQLQITDLVADDVALWVRSRNEGWARLDPNALSIVQRGTAGPAGSPPPSVTAGPG